MEDPIHLNSNLNFLEALAPDKLRPPDASVYLWLNRSFPSDSTHLPPDLESISSSAAAIVQPNINHSRHATLQRLHQVQSLESDNSSASSIDQLLREREADPEELLTNLGFVKNDAVTVPRRFLRKGSTVTTESCNNDEEPTDQLGESVLQAVYRLSHAVSILSQGNEGSLSFQVTGDRFRLPVLQGQQWTYSEPSNDHVPPISRFRSILHPDNQKFLKEQGLYDELIIPTPAKLNEKKPSSVELTVDDSSVHVNVAEAQTNPVETAGPTVLLHLSGCAPVPLSRSRSDGALRAQRPPLERSQPLAISKDSFLDKIAEKKLETIQVVHRAMATIEEIRRWQRENQQVSSELFGEYADQVTQLRTLLNDELNETEILLAHQLRHILQLDDIPIATEWWTQLERIAQEARCLHEALLAFASMAR